MHVMEVMKPVQWFKSCDCIDAIDAMKAIDTTNAGHAIDAKIM